MQSNSKIQHQTKQKLNQSNEQPSQSEQKSINDQIVGKKTHKIKKQLKNQVNKEKKVRQTKQIQKMYWLSIIKYSKQAPLSKLSWKNWKADNFFSTMQIYFNGLRNKVQIKSLDQRLKKRFLGQKNFDILQAIPVALQQFHLSQQEKQMVQNFEQRKKQLGTDTQKKIEAELLISQLQQGIQENKNDIKSLQSIINSLNFESNKNNFFMD